MRIGCGSSPVILETRSDNSMAVAHGRYDPQLIIWLARRTGAPTTAMHCDAPRTCHTTRPLIGPHKYSPLLIGQIWSSCTDGPISPQILAKLMVLNPWLCHVIGAHQCMDQACFWPIVPAYSRWRVSGFWWAQPSSHLVWENSELWNLLRESMIPYGSHHQQHRSLLCLGETPRHGILCYSENHQIIGDNAV